MEKRRYFGRARAMAQSGLHANVIALLFVAVLGSLVTFFRRFVSRGERVRRNLYRKNGDHVALVIVGKAPRWGAKRASEYVSLAASPGRITVYTPARLMNSTGREMRESRSLQDLKSSRCPFCLAIPWDLDLVPHWDALLVEDLRLHSSSVILSSFVAGANRMEQGRAVQGPPALPPVVVLPGRATQHVPDFRLFAGSADSIAALAPLWFPSFWFGLLGIEHAVKSMSVSVATDPVPREGAQTPVPLSTSDRTTLIASYITNPPSDPAFLRSLLAQGPAAHIAMHLPRNRIFRT